MNNILSAWDMKENQGAANGTTLMARIAINVAVFLCEECKEIAHSVCF
jgi:hypothetical protein